MNKNPAVKTRLKSEPLSIIRIREADFSEQAEYPNSIYGRTLPLLARFLLIKGKKQNIMSKEKDIKKETEEMETSKAKQAENAAKENAGKDNTEKEAEKKEEKDPLEAAKEEIADLKDKYLRSVAEFDNYRKRTMKEKAELLLNGAEKTDDAEALKEGMKLIFQKFEKVLGGLGVNKIETKDADFDTDLHEAIAMVPGMGDEKKGKVLDCVLTGYKLNDKVIRHAKVAVGQ